MKKQYIDRFELIKQIGSGSQAVVYLARDSEIDRHVAIKILKPNKLGIGRVENRLDQEAKAAGRLSHTNIVPIYEVGKFYDYPYFVFEYINGTTLHHFLRTQQKILTLPEALSILQPVVDAMAYAHSQGVLHLDLTPKNILFNEDNTPRIMDFGLARIAGYHTDTTDGVSGTPIYMSPEHFTNTPLGPYTDVFSLSLILYEMLVGSPAITGSTLPEAMWQIAEQPVNLSVLPEGRDREKITYILQRGLAIDIQSRYSDATIMKHALAISLDEAAKSTTARIQDTPKHSTIQFLLRRMERKGDFPALSRSLADINCMAADDSMASTNQLATAVLKDYALTNKLLRMANSAFYASLADKVSNISQAIQIVGFSQVRFAANSLAYFSHLQGMAEKSGLHDTMIRSFMSGLIARHLAKMQKLANAEEAFICGIFHNVGETLSAYYLPDEYDEINQLLHRGSMNKQAAAYTVLGVQYSEIGAAAAQHWNFPTVIIEAIDQLPAGQDIPGNQLGRLAYFSNELCQITSCPSAQTDTDPALERLLEQFSPYISITMDNLPTLLDAALNMLKKYADILGMNIEESDFCNNLEAWIHHYGNSAEKNDLENNNDEQPVNEVRIQQQTPGNKTREENKPSWLQKVFIRPLGRKLHTLFT